MKKIILLTMSILMFGCSGLPNDASFGEKPPSPSMYEVKKIFSTKLKDPSSAKYKIGNPVKGYIDNGWVVPGVDWYGWWVPVYVNSKNGFGGYSGFKKYALYELRGDNGSAWVTKRHYNGLLTGAIKVD
jgi:hypothetical protein